MSIDAAAFKAGMRQLAAGVTVVASHWQGERRGLTATAVCSLTAEPPSLLACLGKSTGTCEMVRAAGAFSVNVLAQEQDRIARIFAGMAPDVTGDRFLEGDWYQGEGGMPVLPGALASFECLVSEALEQSTHFVFIGRVRAVHLRDAPARPLLYAAGGFGGFQPLD